MRAKDNAKDDREYQQEMWINHHKRLTQISDKLGDKEIRGKVVKMTELLQKRGNNAEKLTQENCGARTAEIVRENSIVGKQQTL